VTAGLLVLVLSQGADLRRMSNALGVATFALLLWRLISTWTQLTVLEHALGALLATSPLVAAAASFYLLHASPDLPANPILWVVVLHRVACLVLVAFWTQWLGRRRSPFRRAPHSH
jgi:hypothetical protein